MTITNVASYAPIDRRPQAFTLSSPAAVEIDNKTTFQLTVFIGPALRDVLSPGDRRIYNTLNNLAAAPAWVFILPDSITNSAHFGSLVTVNTYGISDPLPSAGLYTPGNVTPPNRSLQSLYMPFLNLERLNVRNFGAIGDGVSNDQPAIQAALNAASVLGGAQVWAPAGDYSLGSAPANGEQTTYSAALQIPSNCSLVGDGPGLTRLKAATSIAASNALLLGLMPAPLAQWYVSTTGTDSPTNGASRATPWRTIAYAVTQITGVGNLIHVAPGAYTEAQINCETAGTASNPNVIISDVPWGAKVTSTASGSVSRAFHLDTQYWWVIGFDITGVSLQVAGIAHNANGCLSAGNFLHQCGRTADGSGINITNFNSSGQVIANNVVLEAGAINTTQNHGIYHNGSAPVIVNNLVIHCDGSGIHCYHAGSTGAIITNNTIVACGAGGGLAGILVGIGGGTTNQNVYVANNIMANNTNYGIKEYADTGGVIGTNTYTNNSYFNNSVGKFLPLGANTSVNEQTTDPLFVNYATDGSGDYRLRSGSPCIGTATSSSLPTFWSGFDLRGDTRPGGSSNDIGCFQSNQYAIRRTALVGNAHPTSGDSDVLIADVTLDGGAVNAAGQLTGVIFSRVQRPQMRNVKVRNVVGAWAGSPTPLGQNESAAITTDLCKSGSLSQVVCYSDDGGPTGSGFMARYSLGTVYTSCSAYGLGGSGFVTDGCNHVRYVGCESYSNTGSGFYVYNSTDVRYEKADAGLFSPPLAGAGFSANQALGNTRYGIEALMSTITLMSVLAARNGRSGLWLDGGATVVGQSVTSRNNTNHGVEVTSPTTGGRIVLRDLQSINNTLLGMQINVANNGVVYTPGYRASGNGTAAYQANGGNFASATGAQTAPGIPASTTPLTSYFPQDMMVEVTGGTVTVIAIDGTTTGRISGVFRVRQGGTITLTYSVAPTWTWFSEN